MNFLEQYNVMIEGRGLKGAAKDRYEAIVTGMVRGIAATQAGAILLSWIKHKTTHRDWVIIMPYSKADEAEMGHCNAYALDDLYPVQVGRREIMAVPVRFTAENFMNSCHLAPNFTPLEILVHELVHAQRIVIGERARITGALIAEEIVVRGNVQGSIRGNAVTFQSSSRVEGDVFHKSLAIEQGAFFEGKSRRSDDPMSVQRTANGVPPPTN